MDPEVQRARDLDKFLRKALEIELEEPGRTLTEEDLKEIALKSGLTEQDWSTLKDRLEAHLSTGRNFLEFGNYSDAVTELEEAVILAPYRVDVLYDCAKSHQNLWETEGRKENRERALELYEQCLRLEPAHQDAAEGLSQIRHRETTTKKKVNRRFLAAAAAVILALGGWGATKLPEQSEPSPTAPKGVVTLPQTPSKNAPGKLRIQRSGNVLAIPRFSGVVPAFPPNLPNDIVQIEAGFSDGGHLLALRENGQVVAWGANNNGQTDVPDLENVIQVAAGWRHSMALLENGTVVAWGDNGEGQCDVPADLNDVIQISAGTRHSVALKSDGTVVIWGSNHAGQGNVPADLPRVIRLAELCSDLTVVITEDGKLAAWGNDHSNDPLPNSTIGSAKVVKVWAGGENYALLDDHRLIHWGRPLKSDQLPDEMTGVRNVYSGFPAAVLIQKTDKTIGLHGTVKDHPDHDVILKNWEKVIISPSFIYSLEE